MEHDKTLELQIQIDKEVNKQIKIIKESADTEVVFYWIRKKIHDVVLEKGYHDRMPYDPEMQAWIVPLIEEAVKTMIHNVIEGHKLRSKDEDGKED